MKTPMESRANSLTEVSPKTRSAKGDVTEEIINLVVAIEGQTECQYSVHH